MSSNVMREDLTISEKLDAAREIEEETEMAKNDHIDIAELKRAADGRWRDIFVSIGGVDPDLLDGRHHECPMCGGTDRFRLIDADAGACFCNQCFSKKNGDGIAAVGWLLGCDFRTAANRIAAHLGVKSNGKPQSNGKPRPGGRSRQEPSFDDQVRWFATSTAPMAELTRARAFERFAKVKSGITVEAIRAADGRLCFWPRKAPEPFECIAFPAQRTKTGDVVGWILYRVNGQDFPAIPNGPGQRKTHTLRGSQDGWVIVGGWDALRDATTIVKVEGVPDALAVYSRLPASYIVITNICGCSSTKLSLSELIES